MDKYTDRVQNLIRVVKGIPDRKFDLKFWWNPTNKCGCAIGHAMQDQYFIKHGIGGTRGPDSITEMAEFFNISRPRVIDLFIGHARYSTRLEVLSALRVLLMEKEAKVAISAEQQAELLAVD